MTVLEKIDNIQKAIFDYEIANIANNTVSVFTDIIDTGQINTNSNQALKQLNELMSACLEALQNKDYLLLADQLEYQLKPIIGG